MKAKTVRNRSPTCVAASPGGALAASTDCPSPTRLRTAPVSAVSQARTHQPDLIILDLGLPAGDGFVVLERLQANMNLSAIPVVVVSARDLQGNKERALKSGAQAFVQKPWNDDELLGIISHLLDQSAGLIAQPKLRPLAEKVDT